MELNICRLFPQVTCSSDISTGDGNTISPTLRLRKPNPMAKQYHWLYQTITHQKSRENWQSAIQKTYNIYRSLALPSQWRLGPWILNSNTTGWVYYYYQDRILHHTSQVWRAYLTLLCEQGISIHLCFTITVKHPNRRGTIHN